MTQKVMELSKKRPQVLTMMAAESSNCTKQWLLQYSIRKYQQFSQSGLRSLAEIVIIHSTGHPQTSLAEIVRKRAESCSLVQNKMNPMLNASSHFFNCSCCAEVALDIFEYFPKTSKN